MNVKFHGTNAERSMIIGQCQLKLQLIPGFIRKSIETEIIETQFSLESSRNVEQDKMFMFRVYLVKNGNNTFNPDAQKCNYRTGVFYNGKRLSKLILWSIIDQKILSKWQ